MSAAVQVVVRARPLSRRELDMDSPFCVEMAGHSTTLYRTSQTRNDGPTLQTSAKEFVFDHSYWSVDSSDQHFIRQEQVYSDLGLPVVEAAFSGYNSCVFAYGQTGSGKTYTMMGCEGSLGLIPRICEGLYARMAVEAQSRSVSYRSEVSYMEIYNEKVRDLLRVPEGDKTKHSLRVREHPKDGPYVEELSHHSVSDYASIAELIRAGNSQRVTASTKMNDTSSRSHAIFTLVITQALFECGVPSETRSKLHLVDLAGSERASATGAQGERLKEGGSINKSLVCLGTVISALAEKSAAHGHKKPYIPYRDSVLTWLLKDSLGGNAKTIMIATISPAEVSYAETLSTLRYANRAKKIINKPIVNEDANVRLIRELRDEIHRLKSIITTSNIELSPEKQRGSRSILAEDLHKKEEQVAELTKEWASKWQGIHQIIQDRDLALHSEGMKMVINSEKPHLVGVDQDILSTGLVFFYLKGESTTVGSATSTPPPDIVVPGAGVHDKHCRLELVGSKVILHPLTGESFINRHKVLKPSRLRQGDLLQLGASAVFRFNHPQEAKRLRKRHSEGLLSPKRLARPQPSRKRTKSQDDLRLPTKKAGKVRSSNSTATSPTTHSLTVELQSRAVVQATAQRSKSSASLTISGRNSKHKVAASHLVLPQEPPSVEEPVPWSQLAAVRKAFSHMWTEKLVPSGVALLPHTEVSLAIPSTHKPVSRWRRWLYCLLLLVNAPLLLMVVGCLTLPAFCMLAVLLSSVKVFGVFSRFWPFKWVATLLALLATLVVSPVAGLCDLIFNLGFSALTSLHLLNSAPKPALSNKPG